MRGQPSEISSVRLFTEVPEYLGRPGDLRFQAPPGYPISRGTFPFPYNLSSSRNTTMNLLLPFFPRYSNYRSSMVLMGPWFACSLHTSVIYVLAYFLPPLPGYQKYCPSRHRPLRALGHHCPRQIDRSSHCVSHRGTPAMTMFPE